MKEKERENNNKYNAAIADASQSSGQTWKFIRSHLFSIFMVHQYKCPYRPRTLVDGNYRVFFSIAAKNMKY